MNKFLLLCIVALCSAGCFGVYDMGLDLKNVRPQIVVNSIITPDSLVKVSVMKSKSVADLENAFEAVEGAGVEIFENGSLIFSGVTGKNGIAKGDVRPKAGCSYSLLVRTEGKELSATTDIPEISAADFSFRQKDAAFGVRAFLFADISSLRPSDCSGLYIVFENEYENGLRNDADRLFSNSNYVDHINMEFVSVENDYKESNMAFNSGFVRIPASVFGSVAPLSVCSETYWLRTGFYPVSGKYDEYGYPVYEEVELKISEVYFRLISPSTDYDRYCRSVYRQQMLDTSSDPFVPAGEPIYSNIKNGTGIFAGYSQYKTAFGVKIPENDFNGTGL